MTSDPSTYKDAVREEWQVAAAGWHRWIPAINAWLHHATEMMLDFAEIGPGSRVIDIAAGDGGQSVAAAERVGASGEVLATDIAPKFVALAREVAARTGLEQLKAQVMDAEALQLPNSSFDAAISRLGLMYLPRPLRGLEEIRRILRRGGRFSAIVFTTAEKTPFFSVPIRVIRERRGWPPPEPERPGPFSLGAPGALVEMLVQAGFQDIQERLVEAPLRFTSAAECVLWRRQASGTMRQMFRGLNADAQAKIWREVEEALRPYETGDGFESPCELLICSGMA